MSIKAAPYFCLTHLALVAACLLSPVAQAAGAHAAEAKPADAPKPPPAAAKEKETIENPYGLEAL